jgi:hypothetical protein
LQRFIAILALLVVNSGSSIAWATPSPSSSIDFVVQYSVSSGHDRGSDRDAQFPRSRGTVRGHSMGRARNPNQPSFTDDASLASLPARSSYLGRSSYRAGVTASFCVVLRARRSSDWIPDCVEHAAQLLEAPTRGDRHRAARPAGEERDRRHYRTRPVRSPSVVLNPGSLRLIAHMTRRQIVRVGRNMPATFADGS